eukprot:1601162-Rhodomonas_salina.1
MTCSARCSLPPGTPRPHDWAWRRKCGAKQAGAGTFAALLRVHAHVPRHRQRLENTTHTHHYEDSHDNARSLSVA